MQKETKKLLFPLQSIMVNVQYINLHIAKQESLVLL